MSFHIHHLSGDNSWLLTFSNNPTQRLSPEDTTLTLLIDPWFKEDGIDYHPWFLRQQHTTSPQFHNFSSLTEFLSSDSDPRKEVDGIIITFEGSDHLHKPTLDEVGPDVPFFAFPRAAAILRSWGRKFVYDISDRATDVSLIITDKLLEADVRNKREDPSRKSLIESLDIRLSFAHLNTGIMASVDCLTQGALALSFAKGDRERGGLVYAPHSAPLDAIKHWKEKEESITAKQLELFAYLANWDVVRVPRIVGGPIVSQGAPGNSKVVQELSPRYWIRTHDELTILTGLVSYLPTRERKSKQEAEAELPESSTKILEMEAGETLAMPLVVAAAA
ncbi:hypothetical protein PQX77_020948 [Marasmius sp. AFHP31]|nr:hypothetical protein PQX77_020948 [Marasmius sp. AFHP31]